MSGNDFFEGFMEDYFAECEEHLNAARSALLALEAFDDDPAAQRNVVNDLFRFYHSLKGISAMVELRPAEQLAHELESYLRALRSGDLSITPAGIGLLIDGTQKLEGIINARRLDQPVPDPADTISRLAALIPTGRASLPAASPESRPDAGSQHRLWLCRFAPTRELLAAGVGVDAVRKQLAAVGTIVEAAPVIKSDGSIVFEFTLSTPSDVDAGAALQDLPVAVEAIESTPALAAVSPVAAAPQGTTDLEVSSGSVGAHVVRVDLSRLDDLMANIGTLVITRSRLLDTLSRIEHHVPSSEWRAVQENAIAVDRQVRTLREGVMRLRLVPIGEIFRRMPFVVRDLARDSGRRVSLQLRGQETEIDKYLIERMMDPVLHLVRNAVSHGIEAPDERIAAGKRPEGTITLSASTAGELVIVEIEDDGRGIDTSAVAARARASGLRVPDGPLDSTALLSLLCSPGFSMRDAADRASGRGVGMAVVKDIVEHLSGSIDVESEPGAGTRFKIQLPLTLSISDVLIGRVGAESFAVPQTAVREVIEVNAADVRLVEQNEIVPYRDGALPLLRLARLFGVDTAPLARFHVYVIGSGISAVGLAVDRIVGQREIVVRAITDPLARVDGISGATDLGDGRVVLILDPASLVRLNRARAARVIGDAAEWGRIRA